VRRRSAAAPADDCTERRHRAYLRQDAFDPVDVSAPLDRQREASDRLVRRLTRSYSFETKDVARQVFDYLQKPLANPNNAERGSVAYDRLFQEIETETKDRAAAATRSRPRGRECPRG
jgi:V/A-type H+-transporting ATPase subunit A